MTAMRVPPFGASTTHVIDMDRRLTYPDIARIFGTGLIATGVGLLLFVVITIGWGDPFTKLSEQGAQEKLAQALDAGLPDADDLRAAEVDPVLTRRQAFLAKKTIPYGVEAGRIKIPRIGLNKVIVHGARNGTPDLTKGPGLYKELPFPGSGKPIAIAGHRTTYGAPFLDIDRLKPGNVIILQMRYGTFTYTVTRQEIISPSDWSIVNYGAGEPTAKARAEVLQTRQCKEGSCEHLVLTACHPKYSAAKRLAVFARLTKVQLPRRVGAATA